MNRRLLPWVVGSFTVALCSASIGFACDKTGASTASIRTASASGVCTPEMAAKCTPEMAAACRAKKGASATNAVMASADHCAGKGTKTSASMASADHCAGKAKASAVMASAGGACGTKGARISNAVVSAKGSAFAVPAGASCSGKGVSTMAGNPAHGGCDACTDMAMCEGELKAAGSQFQIVPLKNGVMYVYTATNARGIRAVQTAIQRRTERMNALVAAEKATLCPDCKAMRGAMASGKLTREIVNVEGGSISLVTSEDASIVAKLYAMAGVN